MKSLYRKIEEEAKPMQDLRDDPGHAEVVTLFAGKLCKIFKADENVVIPAAILHDIGYYGMNKGKLTQLMAGKLPEEEVKSIKDAHMKNGARSAEDILNKLEYDPVLTNRILGIVISHDLNTPPQTIEEKIVRDADKLWRFSRQGFDIDVKRRQWKGTDWYNHLVKNIDKPNYFQTEEARQIAIKELAKRKKECK